MPNRFYTAQFNNLPLSPQLTASCPCGNFLLFLLLLSPPPLGILFRQLYSGTIATATPSRRSVEPCPPTGAVVVHGSPSSLIIFATRSTTPIDGGCPRGHTLMTSLIIYPSSMSNQNPCLSSLSRSCQRATWIWACILDVEIHAFGER